MDIAEKLKEETESPRYEEVQKKKKRQRAKKAIEFPVSETIEKLAFLHMTNRDIAILANISTETLKRRFSKELERGRSEGKRAIRHSIYRSATKYNNIKAQVYLDQKINGDPIENAEQLTDKIKQLGEELYKVAKK